jgi:ferrous iron transport protein A
MSVRKLGEFRPGEAGRIVKITQVSEITTRLMSMGVLEGSWVELVHEAPFGGDPIAVKVRGALIALRRAEANMVEVEVA